MDGYNLYIYIDVSLSTVIIWCVYYTLYLHVYIIYIYIYASKEMNLFKYTMYIYNTLYS